jgi:hypothetical protein
LNGEEDGLMTDRNSSVFNRLRRLQEQNRSDIPAIMTQRAMSSFTLHQESAPEASQSFVNVVIYPQDPFVSEPEVRPMNRADIGPDLVNSRVRIQDSLVKPAKPDSQGNYMYWPGTSEFDQVNSFYYTTFTLRMYERYAHRALPWSFPSPRIAVDPHVGDGANAFYNEQDRLLGFNSFQVNGEFIYAAQSADVVSHETAHAILDGLRDLYNESFGLGATAFHESFGDMSAVLVALHDDSLVKRLLTWSKGDLRLDNFITALAEQITDRLQTRDAQIHGRTVYLRNALNDLISKPFDTLKYLPDNPQVELGRESHNYSRLFTGAFYDILVGIYEKLRSVPADRIVIHRTRDIVARILTCAVELGPVGELDFSDMAKAFLAADWMLFEGKYADVLKPVFDKRGLLPTAEADAFLAGLAQLPDLRLPDSIDSALTAALFLEEKVAPALKLPADLELVPMSAYRNAQWHAYLTYFTHRRISLDGEQYKEFNGSHVDVFGGLTLAFDKNGRLRSAFLRPPTDEDVRQIGILTAELIQAGRVVTGAQMSSVAVNKPLHLLPGNPKGLWLARPPLLDEPLTPAATEPKLVKFPVMFDRVRQPMPDFISYLMAWRRKLEK